MNRDEIKKRLATLTPAQQLRNLTCGLFGKERGGLICDAISRGQNLEAAILAETYEERDDVQDASAAVGHRTPAQLPKNRTKRL